MRRNFSQNKYTYFFIWLLILGTLALTGCIGKAQGELLYKEGFECYGDGNYTKAITKLEQAREAGVSDEMRIHLEIYLGSAYLESDLPELAMESYEFLCEKEPEKVEYWVNLGICHRKLGDYEAAREMYEVALDIAPEDAELNSSLGSLYLLEDNPMLAIEYFKKAIEEDPNLGVAYGNCALAYAILGDFAEAEHYLEQSILHGYQNADAVRERIEDLR